MFFVKHLKDLKGFLAIFLIGLILLLGFAVNVLAIVSNYHISSQASFNQPTYFPLKQEINTDYYYSQGDWIGRLILPSVEELKSPITQKYPDWVWIELYHTSPEIQNLVGQVVRLTWQAEPSIQKYRELVTTDVNFSQAAKISQEKGNVTPTRLNHRASVGPLQSLAGARLDDNVLVRLTQVNATQDLNGLPLLQIAQVPLQITGRFYGLVKIIQPQTHHFPSPKVCPGEPPCKSDFFRVRHYNPKTGQFDGLEETVLIPQQPMLRDGLFASTPRQLEDSPVGDRGWYIYGAKNAQGVFVVQAIKPRSLFQLKPNQIILGQKAGLDYVLHQNWYNTPKRKGTAETVLVAPLESDDKAALSQWKEGDYGLIVHLFGGIGGERGESQTLWTVTGHFSYGLAQVVRDSITKELQFDIKYQQIYAQNTEGIIAGANSWDNYMGNLQRGWMGTRPVSDVVVKLDSLNQDYNFSGVVFSPLAELEIQLQIMAARYRTGDGTGNAAVTPATSCVQDSNQALYIAIEQLKRKIQAHSEISQWLATHPNDAKTLRFQQLTDLGQSLEDILAPHGVIRPDWKQNAERLAGSRVQTHFMSNDSLESALMSWRSMLPRRADDSIVQVFLEQGAQLWFIRTNQVGGNNPEIAPLAPTWLFGEIPLLSTVLRRILAASLTQLTLPRWGIIGVMLGIYAAIAIPIGLKARFLRWNPGIESNKNQIIGIIFAFFTPALLEELIFRVALIPHPFIDDTSHFQGNLWAIFSLILFILYHPLNAISFHKAGNPTFFQPTFLGLTGLLGIICTVVYRLTGSLWGIVLIHWIIVIIWLYGFGGKQRLYPQNTP